MACKLLPDGSNINIYSTWTNVDFLLVRFCGIPLSTAESNFTESIRAAMLYDELETYCQISTISHVKSQNWNVSHLVLQFPLPNLLKLGVKSRNKM